MRLWFLTAAILATGCVANTSPPEPIPTYAIKEKITTTEQRLSWDPFDKNSVRGRATTVFYFISADGHRVEVDMKVYIKHNIGDTYESRWWKE